LSNESEIYKRVVYHEDYYLDFLIAQKEDVKKKIQLTLQLISTQQRIPEKFFKHLTFTDGIFEVQKLVQTALEFLVF
jgi:hypothetical protein